MSGEEKTKNFTKKILGDTFKIALVTKHSQGVDGSAIQSVGHLLIFSNYYHNNLI